MKSTMCSRIPAPKQHLHQHASFANRRKLAASLAHFWARRRRMDGCCCIDTGWRMKAEQHGTWPAQRINKTSCLNSMPRIANTLRNCWCPRNHKNGLISMRKMCERRLNKSHDFNLSSGTESIERNKMHQLRTEVFAESMDRNLG